MSKEKAQALPKYLRDARFWAFYLGDGAGQVQDASSFNCILGSLGLLCADHSWWWAEERALLCDAPLEIEVYRRGRVSLAIRLGEEFDFIVADGERTYLCANIGGHWRLPGLRWEEYARILRSTGLAIDRRHVGLLLLPTVWLCDEAERGAAAEVLPKLFEGVICDVHQNKALAEEWVKAVNATGLCDWRRIDRVWVTNSPESPRFLLADERVVLGELIEQIV